MRRLRPWLTAIYFPQHQLFVILPVAIGTTLAWRDGEANLGIAAICAVATVTHEVGGRLLNYRQDLSTGVDDPHLLPEAHPLVTGKPSLREMWLGGWMCVLLSGVLSSLLAMRIDPLFVVIGPLTVIGTYSYAGGRSRYGHRSLGELGRFVATSTMLWGSYWVQAESISLAALLASIVFGSLAVAGMTVQNERDRDQDLLAGKVTLAVRLGERRTWWFAIALLAVPYLLLPVLATVEEDWLALLPLLTLPWAIWLVRRLKSYRARGDFFLHPRRTIPGMLAFGTALCIGLMVG